MKIHKPIGSKERFLEMFQGVNKLKLNEGFGEESTNMVETAFDALVSGKFNVEQVNNQVNGDETILDISGAGPDGNQASFKFKVSSAPMDQDNVSAISDAKLIQFNFQTPGMDGELPEQTQQIADINASRKEAIMDFVAEYVDTPSPEDTVADELFQEAISLIDKVPYKKGTETIQTNKAYADQKPTNPDVRVQAPELDKFVSELQEFEPEPEADPELSAADALAQAQGDDGSIGVDPMDIEPEVSGEEGSPEEQALYSQAYDNLTAAGVAMPTPDQLDKEVLKLKGLDKPVEKTRAIPKGAEDFWEADSKVSMNADDVVRQGYDTLMPEDKKQQIIFKAAEIIDAELGELKANMPKEMYLDAVRKQALEIYRTGIADMNEEEKKKDSKKIGGDFPKGIGDRFKAKNQMPKKPKKRQNVVKLSEESEEEIPHDKDAEKAARGDIQRDLQSQNHGEDFEDWKYPLKQNTRFDDIYEKEEGPDTGQAPDFKDMPEPSDTVKMVPSGEYGSKVVGDDDDTGNKVQGGLADEKDPVDFDAQQIMIGMGVEMEHTDDPKVALEITMDHLMEIPDYYTRLDKMEKEAKGEKPKEEVDEMKDGEYDEEMTDELLGFKPHNVGDYANEELDLPASPEQEKNYWDAEYFKQDQEAEPPEGQEEIIDEEDGFEEYQGDIGDRYQDGEGNQFTVRDRVKGGVTLQGQGGESEIATSDIKYLKKL